MSQLAVIALEQHCAMVWRHLMPTTLHWTPSYIHDVTSYCMTLRYISSWHIVSHHMTSPRAPHCLGWAVWVGMVAWMKECAHRMDARTEGSRCGRVDAQMSEKGEVLLRGVGTLCSFLILSENSACQVPICAVAAWLYDNPHQQVVPRSRIPRSISHFS